MEVIVCDHPLAATQLTKVRETASGRAEFRHHLGELSRLLVYEATRELDVTNSDIDSPLGPTPGTQITSSPLLVPVLRAGLGMLDAALALLPNSEVAFVGAQRLEEPGAVGYEFYMDRIPADITDRSTLVLDPALATGGTLVHACEQTAKAGATSTTAVCVLASPQGIAAVESCGFVDRVVVAAIDSHLNDDFYIIPGLGDAGDRLYGRD